MSFVGLLYDDERYSKLLSFEEKPPCECQYSIYRCLCRASDTL